MSKIENVIFYGIDKGYNDVAYFSSYAKAKVLQGDAAAMANAHAATGAIPAGASHGRRMPPNGNMVWSTVAEPGRNKYVLRLTGNTDTIFNNTGAAVDCLAPHINHQQPLIESVTRLSDNCASFVVDTDHVLQCIKASDPQNNLTFGQGYFASLPLYFNLIDGHTGLPVWLAANHYHGQQSSAGHSHTHTHKLLEKQEILAIPEQLGEVRHFRRHGGVHLTGFVSLMYVDLA